jgi:hypothetical protein
MSIPPPPPRRRASEPADANVPSPPPVDPEARAARRAESKSGAPRSKLLLGAVVLVAVALIAVGVVVVSGGGGKDTPELDKSTSVQLTLGELLVESVNPFNATFPTDASDAALAVVEAYVHEATVLPLRNGAVTQTALPELFDDAAVTYLATATDRAVLFDEGLPKAVGKVTVEGVPVALTVLLDNNKAPKLLTATLDLEIEAQSKTGLMTVHRTGSLVLSPQLDGSWKITAWTLHVERAGPGVTPTPTDATTTTTVTP